jgi:tetratricopeptide (TPR) repeat protein
MSPPPTTDASRHHHTLRLALASLKLAQAAGRPWALAEAHREAALAYRQLNAWPSALAWLEHAWQWAQLTGGVDQALDIQCDLVETLALLAEANEQERTGGGQLQREQARDLVCQASHQASRVADPSWEVTVLLRLSDVLDRFGDRDEATLLQVRALQRSTGHAGYGTSSCQPWLLSAHTH